jgi:uncharacterized membrane protein
MPLGTLAATPAVAAIWLVSGRPGLPWPAWAVAALSGAVELAYFHALSHAYRRGDASAVYPVARGTAPALAVLVGLLALHERLAVAQLVGVAVVVAGIWLARPPLGARSALPAAVLTGVLIAAYSAIDKVGVGLGPSWLYAWAVFASTSLWLLPWARFGLAAQALPVGVLSVTSYGLVLLAFGLAPLALVAPLRESGVVVVALYGVLRLRERERALPKLAGAGAVLCGAALLAAG